MSLSEIPDRIIVQFDKEAIREDLVIDYQDALALSEINNLSCGMIIAHNVKTKRQYDRLLDLGLLKEGYNGYELTELAKSARYELKIHE